MIPSRSAATMASARVDKIASASTACTRSPMLVQDISNSDPQGGLGRGLLNQIDIVIKPTLVHDRIARIPGHEQHLDAGALVARSAGKLAAVLSRQNDVGQQQIDIVLL